MPWPSSPKYPEKSPEDADSEEYNYIIIGGGATPNTKTKILLLGCGTANHTYISRISRIPLLSANILDASTGTKPRPCKPMTQCDNRQSLVFRADVLSGASRVDSEVYTRRPRRNYEGWKEMGRKNCGVRELGVGGFGDVFKEEFADAAETMGFSRISDANVAEAPIDGVAMLYLSTEVALQIQREKNLTICTNTTVHRIEFEDEDEDEDGVPCADKVVSGNTDPMSTRTLEVKVKKEVIICSGALGSAQVLMLSNSNGIGPHKHLEEHNIKVIHDLPGVGYGLANHPSIPVAWEVPMNESITQVAVSPLKAVIEFGKYLLFGTGIMSFPTQTVTYFVLSKSLNEGPFIEEGPTRKTPQSTPTESPHHPSTRPQDPAPDIELMPLATIAMEDNLDFLFSETLLFLPNFKISMSKMEIMIRLTSLYIIDSGDLISANFRSWLSLRARGSMHTRDSTHTTNNITWTISAVLATTYLHTTISAHILKAIMNHADIRLFGLVHHALQDPQRALPILGYLLLHPRRSPASQPTENKKRLDFLADLVNHQYPMVSFHPESHDLHDL
ncbi:hypothetical protein SBOR_6499 [Sclerotinia borealis F-4128]|uniref:Glucose-methanol-choline oxidoreductase N-terminal domain-containing protein n=1 Tax=Sclerotinia borealis (strain F-4128) TaxID=1432307 RepID=W9C8P5_SCLBF|nr:hypothetical protein SBOR_6499 [Sclerotinia borealis F-4128]